MAEGRQEPAAGAEGQGGLMGDAVPRNGHDDEAARRAHMREQTTARQAAERRAQRPLNEAQFDAPERAARARRRGEELKADLERIDAAHRAWLREHEPADRSERGAQPRSPSEDAAT